MDTAGPIPRFLARMRREPSRALLVAQVAALLLYPFAVGNRAGHAFATALSVGVLALAIRMVDQSPRKAWVAAMFAVLGVLAWQLHISRGSPAIGVFGALCYAIAYFYSAWALIAYMMQDDQTTLDEMWAAGATFMLFVEAYAWLFVALQTVQPGAFVVPGGRPDALMRWIDLVFLSGTNFSATGISDILPGTPHARMLLLVQQCNGVMYLAIVVARRAGMIQPARRE